MITPLYAWAIPAFFSEAPVDHTWVTDYDNTGAPFATIQDVVNAGNLLWYCWGSFHPVGGTPSNPTGALGSQKGDSAIAQCLVAANSDSSSDPAARGTIFTYGVDGVCHQLANQVLFATGINGASPLTVSAARGYAASSFIYGTYGLQHAAWASKMASCSPQVPTQLTATGPHAVASSKDEFEIHARKVLGEGRADLLTQLLSLRNQVHTQRVDVMASQQEVAVSAETINKRNQAILDQAAGLVGREIFIQLFGFPPEQRANLVDPNLTQK